MKKNKGITLIALIITVILMLILASVALSAIGDAGLFDKTQQAADRYNDKVDEEKSLLENLINSVEKYAYSANNNQEPDAPVIVVDTDKPSIETFDVQLKARGDDSYTFTVTLKASDATSNIKFFELYCGYYQDDAMYVEELATPTKNVNISKDIVISDHGDALESLVNTSWEVVVYDSATEPNVASATFDVQGLEISRVSIGIGTACEESLGYPKTYCADVSLKKYAADITGCELFVKTGENGEYINVRELTTGYNFYVYYNDYFGEYNIEAAGIWTEETYTHDIGKIVIIFADGSTFEESVELADKTGC